MADSFVPNSQEPYFGTDTENNYSYYSPHSVQALERAKPFVRKALEEINFKPETKRAFTIADYGTADGGVSMDIINYIIELVKEKYGKGHEIQILYEDQATADFNLLFRNIHGLRNKPTSRYLKPYEHIFVNACATNFYTQCFPTESVDLAISVLAILWMSERPCKLKSSLWVTASNDPLEIETFKAAEEKDYELFLVNRAKELVSGGALVLCNLTLDENNDYGKGINHSKQPFEMLEKLWSNMLHGGKITTKEFEATTFNMYIMTKEEFIAPFVNKESATCKAGLRLESAHTELLPCPLNTSWHNLQTKDDMAAKEHAKNLVLHTRVWSNWTFMSGLNDMRSKEEKGTIVDELFSRYEEEIVKEPGNHGEDFIETYLVIRKVENMKK